MRMVRDRTGERVNNYVILSYAGVVKLNNGSTNALWNCKCDCGKEFQIYSGLIRNGSKTQSCGCMRGRRIFDQKYPTKFVKHYHMYKGNAAHRDIQFDLSKDQVLELSLQPCHYCGVSDKDYRGIDRTDSTLGYSIENCVPCCTRCNRMKSDITYTDFISQIRAIYKNRCRD